MADRKNERINCQPRNPGTKIEIQLSFFPAACRFTQGSARALRFDRYLVYGLTAEPLLVERDGARACDNFDVFELQRLAARRQQGGIFNLPPAATVPENHLRPRRLREPVIAPFLKRQISREKIATLFGQCIFVRSEEHTSEL